MKSWQILFLILAAWALLAAIPKDQNLAWYQAWDGYLSTGNCAEKMDYLELSIEKKPEPALELRARRTDFVRGYFPYLRMAEAALECGDLQTARARVGDARLYGGAVRRELNRLGQKRSLRPKEEALFQLALERQARLQELERRLVGPDPEPIDGSPPPLVRRADKTSPRLDSQDLDDELADGRGSAGGQPKEEGRISELSDPPFGNPEIRDDEPLTPPGPSPPISAGDDAFPPASPAPPELGGTSEEELEIPEPAEPNPVPAPDPVPPPLIEPGSLPPLEMQIGSALTIKCRQGCAYQAQEGILKIGDGQPISLPRGYSILSVNGERISPPHLANEPTSYDGDLRSIQALFELKKAGRAKIEVLRDGHPPTAWLAGAALFYYPAWPSHLPQACANRFDELSALKVIELRFEHNQLLRILASEFSEHRVNNPAAR